ncbi:dipeptidyl aminopeptidase/acylaminoacyl peptidase [Catenulispora sp. GP43]|uniref:hypothetical protein n=1 Tax=Catenulispora sp. GP43 TaxID=3156263 RepID=UPI003519C7D3
MSRSSSRRLLVTAAAATSVALLASACGKSAAQPGTAPVAAATHTSAAVPGSPASPATSASSTSPASPAPQYAAGAPLISDGTATVTVAGTPVTFPTTVSEASWSPDGSRIAFIDGSGNVATARPDGSACWCWCWCW